MKNKFLINFLLGLGLWQMEEERVSGICNENIRENLSSYVMYRAKGTFSILQYITIFHPEVRGFFFVNLGDIRGKNFILPFYFFVSNNTTFSKDYLCTEIFISNQLRCSSVGIRVGGKDPIFSQLLAHLGPIRW